MIDKKYTETVQKAIADQGVATFHVFTEKEIDWLLDDGAEDTTGGIIELAQEAILRSTGLPVDLSTQGPARTVLTLSDGSPGQEHNTYIISDQGTNLRNLSSIKRDRDTIPKITPQDSNVAMRSLDFPSTRTTSTPLDKMVLDDKDNPADAVFAAQLTVAQLLHMWNVDIVGLTIAINEEWGIDYAQKLIEDVAFLRTSVLEEFIASGGRPPPAINMSQNVMSKFSFVASPTVDPLTIGFSSAFVGRCRMMAKFIMATATAMRGNKCIDCASFHMNASHMSTFAIRDLDGWSLPDEDTIQPTKYRSTVVGINSYKEYVSKRQAVAVAEANARMGIARAIISSSAAVREGLTCSVGKYDDTPSDRIMAGRTMGAYMKEEVLRDSDPAKLSAILFDLFNGNASSKQYMNVIGSCAAIVAMCSVTKVDLDMAKILRPVMASRGMGDAMTAVNYASVARNNFLKNIMKAKSSADKKIVLLVVLLNRHLDYVRASVQSALASSYTHVKHTSTKGTTWAKASFRGSVRPWVSFQKMLSGNPKPFSQINRHRRAATIDSTLNSMLEFSKIDMKKVAQGRSDYFQTTRAIGAGVREHWSDTYAEMAKMWQISTYVTLSLSAKAFDYTRSPSTNINNYEQWKVDRVWYAGYMAYVEMVYAQAMSLAYKWSRVRIGAKVVSALATTNPAFGVALETELYVTYIRDLGSEEPEVDVELEVKWFKGNGKAAIDLEKKCNYLMTGRDGALNIKSTRKNKLESDIFSMFPAAKDRVRASMREAACNDRDNFQRMNGDERKAPVRIQGTISSGNATADFIDNNLPMEADKWEDREDKSRDEVDNLTLMLNACETTTRLQNSTDLCKDIQDLLVSLCFEVGDFDASLEYVIDQLWKKIDDSVYLANRIVCDDMVATIKTLAGAESLTIEMAVDKSLRVQIMGLATKLSIAVPTQNIMS